MVSSILLVIVFIGVLVTIHEFGHLVMAKLSRIPVEAFSIGFGPAILKRKLGETEYRVSLIPLGGYIKMAGENEPTTQAQTEIQGFNQKPLGIRIAVIAAGPLANLLLGFLLLFCLYVIFGLKHLAPIVDPQPDSPATSAGLRTGDLVIFAAGETIPSFEALEKVIARYSSQSLPLVIRRGEEQLELVYQVPKDTWLTPATMNTVVGGVKPGSPAANLGLLPGDTIVMLNGVPVRNWEELVSAVRVNPGKRISIGWRREGKLFNDSIVPSIQIDPRTKTRIGQLGIWAQNQRRHIEPLVPPIVGQVRKFGPADGIGLRRGDSIISVNGVSVSSWNELVELISSQIGTKTEITWRRNGATYKDTLIPSPEEDQLTGLRSGSIGIWAELPRTHLTLSAAFKQSLARTGQVVVQTFSIIYQVLTRRISGRAIGGPIMVAKIAYEGASWGTEYFLALWALLSINLFVVNMLPIPVLDGGRIALLLVEGIRRRPLTEKELSWAGNIGWLLIGALVFFTLLNDILRLFIHR